MKKQRGLSGNNNNNYKGNKEDRKILLITLSVIAVILAITFSVVIIINVLDSKNESDSLTESEINTEVNPEEPEKPKRQSGNGEEPGETSVPESDIAVEDTITLGTYEQDNNSSNGKEPIKWRVLAIEGGKALVISEYGLDCKPYHEEYEAITWRDCSLRAWLNSDFYNAAFSDEEKNIILKETIIAEDNSEYGTDAGEDTKDNVFLLSISEVEKYFRSTQDRECKPTDYAVAQGAWQSADYKDNCWWWLRSPCSNAYTASGVYSGGGVFRQGGDVNRDDITVRPALWIKL